MNSFIIENKKIYLDLIYDDLCILIYQGFESIYKDIVKSADEKRWFSGFQLALKGIPTWSNDTIDSEKRRILLNVKDGDRLINMIKLVIKYNLIQLSLHRDRLLILNESIFRDFNMNDFIHKLYSNLAKEFYFHVYLFYHKISPIDISKNRNNIFEIIRNNIDKVLIYYLPLEEIIEKNLEITLPDYYRVDRLEGVENHRINLLNSYQNPVNQIEPMKEVNDSVNERKKMEMMGGDIGSNSSKKKSSVDSEMERKNKEFDKIIDDNKTTHDDILSIINKTKTSDNLDVEKSSTKEVVPIELREEKVINLGDNVDEESETEVSFVPPSDDINFERFSNAGDKDEKKNVDNLSKKKYFSNYLKP